MGEWRVESGITWKMKCFSLKCFRHQIAKPQNSKMIPDSSSLFLSSPSNFLFLNYALQLSVSECVINREAHSLFILIPYLTMTH